MQGSRPRRGRTGYAAIRFLVIAAAVAFACQKVISFFGPTILLTFLVIVALGMLYAVVSFRSLLVPFLVLMASVSLLRFMWVVHVPVLPDMFFDRISLVWLIFVFLSMAIYKRQPLRGPHALDFLMVIHAAYILVRVLMTDKTYFALWVASLVTPYLIYWLAKNIIITKERINAVLVLLGVLSFYYTVTSISEKFSIDFLLYPAIMREPHPIAVGRSSGPFRGPGIFGDTMAMMLPVYFYFIARAQHNLGKLLFIGIFMFGTVAILFTYTRGSWLAAILAVIVVVLTGRRTYLRLVIPAVIAAPLIGLTIFGVQQDEFLEERIGTTQTAESRAGNLVTALRLWRDYPIFGVGSYQFQEYSDLYIGPVELPLFGTMRVDQFRGSPAHDMYLGPLAEDGTVGFVLQLLIHFMIIRISLQKLQLQKQGDYFATYVLPIFFGIYTVYLFGGFIVSFRHFAVIGSLYYMAAGITYGYRPERTEKQPIEPGSRVRS